MNHNDEMMSAPTAGDGGTGKIVAPQHSESLSPEEAIARLQARFLQGSVDRLWSTQTNPQYMLNILRERSDLIMEELKRGMSGNTEGSVVSRPGVASEIGSEPENLEFNFGYNALSKDEIRKMLGDGFTERAKEAFQKNKGVIRHELKPGVILTINVGDVALESEAQSIDIVSSYGTVPLVGSEEYTAEKLVTEAVEQFASEAESTYDGWVSHPAARRVDHWGNELNVSVTAPEAVEMILERTKFMSAKTDFLTAATTPGVLSRFEKLFVLATMQDAIIASENVLPKPATIDLDERIKTVGPRYMEVLAVNQVNDMVEDDGVVLAMEGRTVLPQIPESEKKEIIRINMEALKRKLTGYQTEGKVEHDVENAVDGIAIMTVYADGIAETRIIYRTSDGKIGWPESKYLPGDYSVLRTALRRLKDGGYLIELYHDGGVLTVAEIDALLMGKAEPETEERVVMPERLMPGQQIQQRGILERWGESKLTPNIQGDTIFLDSIRQFNRENSH